MIERERERGWEDRTSVSKRGRDWGGGKEKKRLVGWEILFLRYLNGGNKREEGCGAVWYRRDRRGGGGRGWTPSPDVFALLRFTFYLSP